MENSQNVKVVGEVPVKIASKIVNYAIGLLYDRGHVSYHKCGGKDCSNAHCEDCFDGKYRDGVMVISAEKYSVSIADT